MRAPTVKEQAAAAGITPNAMYKRIKRQKQQAEQRVKYQPAITRWIEVKTEVESSAASTARLAQAELLRRLAHPEDISPADLRKIATAAVQVAQLLSGGATERIGSEADLNVEIEQLLAEADRS